MRAALLLAVLLLAAPGLREARAQLIFGKPEGPVQEAMLPQSLPAVPAGEGLAEFYVSPTTTIRFALDPASVAIDGDTVVRFTLVATSASGVRNVSYEAIRCAGREQRLFAIARPDGSWSLLRTSSWRPVSGDDTVNRQHTELLARLCDVGRVAGSSPEHLLARLRATPAPMMP